MIISWSQDYKWAEGVNNKWAEGVSSKWAEGVIKLTTATGMVQGHTVGVRIPEWAHGGCADAWVGGFHGGEASVPRELHGRYTVVGAR